MLTYEQALKRIVKETPSPRPARVALQNALGLVLAERIIASLDLPPFDNSAVDGYAVCLPAVLVGTAPACAERSEAGRADRQAGLPKDYGEPINTASVSLKVVGCSSAGSPYQRVVCPGEAVRIFTGAVVPRGTDRVMMQEQVSKHGERIIFERRPDIGRNIRRRGEDLRQGTRVLEAGTQLRPQEIGLLAALGYRDVPVYPAPTVAILTTGNELQQARVRLKPGHIYESNGALLHALVIREGAHVIRLGPVRDVFRQLVAHARRGLRSDVLLVSGGVSVGEKDLVRLALKTCGVKEIFWQVNIKPGMPLFFGKYGRTLVFGLPGNPVSTFVTFEEFVKPALYRLMGQVWRDGYTEPAVLVTDLNVSATRRTHFLRVRCSSHNQLVAEPLNGQGSHQLRSLVEADGWIRVVSNEGPWPAGTQVLVKPACVARVDACFGACLPSRPPVAVVRRRQTGLGRDRQAAGRREPARW